MCLLKSVFVCVYWKVFLNYRYSGPQREAVMSLSHKWPCFLQSSPASMLFCLASICPRPFFAIFWIHPSKPMSDASPVSLMGFQTQTLSWTHWPPPPCPRHTPSSFFSYTLHSLLVLARQTLPWIKGQGAPCDVFREGNTPSSTWLIHKTWHQWGVWL